MKSLKGDKHPTQWWQRYQPQDYRVIDNELGNTVDFKEMIEELKRHDLRVYVDVVFNHMANESWLRKDLQYPSASEIQAYQEQTAYFDEQKLFGDLSSPLFTESDFLEAFGITDWENAWEVQNGRLSGGPHDPGLPSLALNDNVVSQQQAYLLALKKLGVKGFRIDAAKHLSIEHIKAVFTDDIVEGMHIFGEIITDGGASRKEYELFLKPYLEQTRLAAYDFPLFNTVFNAFQPDGVLSSLVDPYCFGDALSRSRAITFAVTHDIPNNDAFRGLVMDEQAEWLSYCYVLCRDGGVPLIYTDLDTSGIKNSAGEPRWVNAWKDKRMVDMIRFHNVTHCEKMSVLEVSDDHLVFQRGKKGLVIINRGQEPKRVLLRRRPNMSDIATGEQILEHNGIVEFECPANSYRMFVCQ
jgi:alpha-amylase